MEKAGSFNQIIANAIQTFWDCDSMTDYGITTLQYKDVARIIEKLHILFEHSGVKPGDKVALCGKNQCRWGAAFFAITTYGAVAVPILHEFHPTQIHDIVNHSDAKLLFVEDKIFLDLVPEQMPNLEGILSIIDYHRCAIIDRVNRCNAEGQAFYWSMLDGLKVRTGASTRFTDWMEYQIRTRHLADGTRAHQLTVLEFLREQGVTDFGQLDVNKVMELDKVLHNRKVNGKPLQQTSIYGYHKVIRCYINLAICAGLMDRTPYSRFKVSKGESAPRDVLTIEEIHRIEQLQPQSLYLKHVRDLFLLQIWTGLSYSDLMAADFTQIRDNTLSGYRVKTSLSHPSRW